MTLEFWQIIYKEEQISYLYPFANVWFNNKLTPYFENSGIAELVPQCEADYIGICSWRLKEKRGFGSTPMILNNDITLTREKICSREFDVALLRPTNKTHAPFENARAWHFPVWEQVFPSFKKLLTDLGIKCPIELDRAIYENAFIARREIYQEYVEKCLKPVMAEMDKDPIYMTPSTYKNKNRDQAYVKEVCDKLGMDDWPIAPFMLERLFSIWIHGRNLIVINL
jgi:hypothetical protein